MKTIDQEHVWDEIARKWSEFREVPSPTVIEFLKQKHGRVLDLGCGSGRNFSAMNLDTELYGVDFSEQMLLHAKERAEKLGLKADLVHSYSGKLKFKDNFFDSIICVAVLHCISTKEERVNTLREIYRTLKPKSTALISVWGKNSPRLKNKPKECYVSWTVSNSLLNNNRSNDKSKKITNANCEEEECKLEKSREGEKEIKQERYTYIYDLEELKKEVLEVGFKIESIWEERNVNVICRK